MTTGQLEDEVIAAFAAEQQILSEHQADLDALADEWAAAEGVERGPFQERVAARWAARRNAPPPWVSELVRLADANASLARVVLSSGGWPTAFSETGVFAFAAIIAHADDDQPLRRTACTLLFDVTSRSEGTPRLLAHLVDRSQLVDGEPQIFGSLLVPDAAGARYLVEIIAPDQLDERRQRIGLPPAADDIDRYRRGAVPGPFLIPLGGD